MVFSSADFANMYIFGPQVKEGPDSFTFYLTALPIGQWRGIELLFETFAEIVRRTEPRAIGNLRNAHLRMALQKRYRSFESDRLNEIVRRTARNGLNLLKKIRTRHSHLAGEKCHVELRIVHMFPDDGRGPVNELLVTGIGRQHQGGRPGLTAESFLQNDPAVDQVVTARQQQFGIEWFGDIIVRSIAESFQVVLQSRSGRKQDNRNMAGVDIFLNPAA